MNANTLKPAAENSDYTVNENKNAPTSDHLDEQLVSGCIKGDRRAQRRLFDCYKSTVYGLTTRLLGPNHDLDDITQQVFIKLFSSLANFKGMSSLNTWVYRITFKVCTDQLRKKYRKRQLPLIADSDELAINARSSPDGMPLAGMERRELTHQIYQAMDRLSPDKRMALVLYEMEDKDLEQIAEIIQKPLGTVKSRLFHARREMQRHLKRYLET